MKTQIQVGTATAVPGTVQTGRWDAFVHPTGHTEFFPVIIAQGREPGPCFWLTAGIHGPEHTGPVVLYGLLNEGILATLKGTIVAIPALSPAGLRTHAYVPYHVDVNPNRLWPDGKNKLTQDPEKHPPTSLEQAYSHLFEKIRATADYLIDYHNAWTDSLSFVFRDRVLFHDDTHGAANKAEAIELARMQAEMIQAYGHTVIIEYTADKYIKEDLHRSTSGSALLVGKIPGFTVELGTGHLPDPAIVAAAQAGTRNVFRWAGMVPGDPEPIRGIRIIEPGYPVRRTTGVRAPCTGIVMPTVGEGDLILAGDVLATMIDVWGKKLGDVVSDYEGFLVGRAHGIYHYEGDTILHMAIRDEAPIVAPYPEEFYKEQGQPITPSRAASM